METVTLSDLGPILAAVLGPMLAFVVVSMRYQHHDGAKTRELIERLNLETREEATRQIERAVDKLSADSERAVDKLRGDSERAVDKLSGEFAEHKRTTEKNHREVTRSLADARERLARIEGHLRIGAPPPDDNEEGEEGEEGRKAA